VSSCNDTDAGKLTTTTTIFAIAVMLILVFLPAKINHRWRKGEREVVLKFLKDNLEATDVSTPTA
jgi:hypothetical protein